MMLFLAAYYLLAIVACTMQDTGISVPEESTVTSSGADVPIPEESSIPHKFSIGNDERGMEEVREAADDYHRSVIDAKKMGWEDRRYTYGPVYGSGFEDIWPEMVGMKPTSYSDWTFYALDVELDNNQRRTIVIRKSPENKWEVVNLGN